MRFNWPIPARCLRPAGVAIRLWIRCNGILDRGAAAAAQLGRDRAMYSRPTCFGDLQRCRVILALDHRADRLMDDKRWIDRLDAVGAQAALEALNQHFRGGMTVREAVEFRKLKKALQARANPED